MNSQTLGENDPGKPQGPIRVVEGGPGSLAASAADRLADEYAERARSDATRRSYRASWATWTKWCAENNYEALPASPETVRRYLVAHADVYKPATLAKQLVAISQIHQEAGHEPPTRANAVRKVLTGIKRAKGTAQVKKEPLPVEDLTAIVQVLPTTVYWGVRDRALLLIGWAGALRRSELVALDVEDVRITREGMILTLRKSKTDQEGKGEEIGILYGENRATCPVFAYREWIRRSGIKTGAIFRPIDQHGNIRPMRLSSDSVARIIKAHVPRVGLDKGDFAGHSLRSGFITTAAERGQEERVIAAQSRHKSMSVLRGYIKRGNIFRQHPGRGIGL